MPIISRFFGIVISMYYEDHHPPHFHVRYSGTKAIIGIETLSVLEGKLPPRAHGLVVDWASRHRSELLENWMRARDHKRLDPIEPLG